MTIVNARSIDEALHALEERPGILPLQGGTDAMVAMNFGHLAPHDVLSLRRLEELRQWWIDADGSIVIGAGLPYAAMENGALAEALPALAQAARTVGSPQIRAAGSIGGNLGTCSPAGDALPVLSACEATVELRSLHGSRTIPFAEFMVGPKRSVRQPNELIMGVRIRPTRGFQGYAKVGVRNAMVISVASACVVVDAEELQLRIALGSVGPTIIRCTEAETHVAASMQHAPKWHVSPVVAQEASVLAAAASKPIDDHRSTATYRRHAVTVLTRRLLERSNNV